MENAVTGNHHKEQLTLLAHYLDNEGWSVDLQAPIEDRPYDAIIVNILSDDDRTQVLWAMELSFLPIAANDMPDMSILQCFIPLANTFPQLLKPELMEMIILINTKLPIVGFGFLDGFSLLYYKHNLMLPNAGGTTNGMLLSQTLGMITHLVSTFTGPIIEVAIGEKSIADAVNNMQFKELFT